MKCFRINEFEWIAANSLEEAVQAHMKMTGCPREDVLDEMYAGEVTEKQLKDIDIYDDQGQFVGTAWKHLQVHIAEGKEPGYLFGTEG